MEVSCINVDINLQDSVTVNAVLLEKLSTSVGTVQFHRTQTKIND